MVNPSQESIEEVQKILTPLFNTEPHPFQEEWSDLHSMSSEQMINAIAEALDRYKTKLKVAREALKPFADYLSIERDEFTFEECEKVLEALKQIGEE